MNKTSEIAVIGLSGKFPGEASNPEKLWDLCARGEDAWSSVPSARFNQDAFYHPDGSRNGSNNVKGGFFLNRDLSRFDAPFFNLTRAEAASLDPEQRLLLECAYETFENAGVTLEAASGSQIGVYIGTFMNDWGEITRRDPDAMPMYQPTGSGHSMLAGRLSYFYDLKGPSMTIDTACSASFVALHNACTALRNNECSAALVGGVNSVLNHDFLTTMSSMSFLSPDGKSFTYDSRANGYARGEGVVCILLKTMEQALRDKDHIRAVIRGVALNQDGRTPGITHPNGAQQVALIRKVYADAQLDPCDTAYVETHGTGTQAGDVTEANALHDAFGSRGASSEPLIVGSVKTNIGHLEGASGLAGLVKTVMMLERETVLPNSGFEKANDKIKLKEWNMEVPTQLRKWPESKALRASINNFGYAGTNAHVIVEQTNSYLTTLKGGLNGRRSLHQIEGLDVPHVDEHAQHPRPHVFVLSARDEVVGKVQSQQLASYLRQNIEGSLPPDAEADFLVDLAAILADCRSRFTWKSAVTASTISDLATVLDTVKSQNAPKEPSLAFVFNGQGAQWHAMGRELLDLPHFKESLTLSCNVLASLGADWDPRIELRRDAHTTRVNEAMISQPLCTVLQLALVDLLSAWNIKPSSVVGHSSGELAAAYAAGHCSRQDALAAAYYRGIAAAASNNGHACAGAMMAIPLGEEDVNKLLAKVNKGEATLACYNSPSSTTISGDDVAITELLDICQTESIQARKLIVDVAYHSPRMASVSHMYIKAIEDAAQACSDCDEAPERECVMYSSVTGARVEKDAVLGPRYWADNLTKPVRFVDAMEAMYADREPGHSTLGNKSSVDCLIEIGPHSALAGPINQILRSQHDLARVTYFSALTRHHDAMMTVLSLATKLFTKGCVLNLSVVNDIKNPPDACLCASLPSYPWNLERSYWAEPRASKQYRERKWPRHDLLGAPVNFSNNLEPRWRNWLRVSELPWLRDHKVNGLIVYPAAGYITMAIEGMRQEAITSGKGIEGYQLRDVHIRQALVIPDSSQEVETMMTMRPYPESGWTSSAAWNEFFVYSASEEGTFTEHCRGLISVNSKTPPNEVNGVALAASNDKWQTRNRDEIEKSCIGFKTETEIYKSFSSTGLDYEGIFANILSTRFGSNHAKGRLAYPDVRANMPMQYHSPFVVHPSFLDSTFQVAVCSVDNGDIKAAMVPTFIANVFVSECITKTPGSELAVYTRLDGSGFRNAQISLDVFEDHLHTAVISVKGLTVTTLGENTAVDSHKGTQDIYYPKWQPDPELLTSEQFAEVCVGSRVHGPSDEILEMLDKATFYMAEEAVAKIPIDKVPCLSPKSQKLYHSFKNLCEGVYSGSLPQDVTGWTRADEVEREKIWKHVGDAGDEGALYLALRENLHHIILEEADPLAVVMKDDLLGKYYAADIRMATQCRQAAAYINLQANKNPRLKILEVGAGTGGATVPILQSLWDPKSPDNFPRFSSYDVTDISTGFFEKLKSRTEPWAQFLTFGKLNIEEDPGTQGYEIGTYDLVVASNVLHATASMEVTLGYAKKLLRPGGKLILVELMKDVRICTRIFGVFDGWWIGESDDRSDSPLLNENGWETLMKKTGFTGLDLKLWDLPNPSVHQGTTMISTRAFQEQERAKPLVLTASEGIGNNWHLQALQESVAASLGTDLKCRSIVDLGPDTRDCPAIVLQFSTAKMGAPSDEEFEHIKQALLGRDLVLWVTWGATVNSLQPSLNLISGLLASLRIETGTVLGHLDLDAATDPESPIPETTILRVWEVMVNNKDLSSEQDLDFVERGGFVKIRRFEKDIEYSRAVESAMGHLVPEVQPFVQADRPLKLKVEKPGLLDSLYFIDDQASKRDLQGDEVEIEVHATALNFRDVMMAMGQIETHDLGAECSGIVTRIGTDVIGFRVGDKVLAQAFGTISTLARTREMFVSKLPDGMSMEEAATLPIVYSTAVYAAKAARLAAGETVLIHCAAGGLGQALVMLCKLYGAESYVTVGTAQKKQFMMDEYGIPEERIFFSRDSDFEQGIMRATDGRGVDIVFNSLSSDLLRATWSCIAPFGRFIELGKRDFAVNARLDMAKFARNVTFTAVDLAAVIQERPKEAAIVQREAIDLIVAGKVRAPQPISVYNMSDLQTALRTMQTGRHMGKLVLKPTASDSVKVLPRIMPPPRFRSDASYLLLGGLGGIGRSWALRMIELGAKTLIFVSPSGAQKPAQKAAVEHMRALGTTIHVFTHQDEEWQSSVTDELFAQISSLPPIKGVFHAASNFKSELFKSMDVLTFKAGFGPKYYSTEALAKVLPRDLDHFVFLSSATGIVGNASQAAYSAGSSYQDAFSEYRNNVLGLPAVSIDLGMVGDVGHVAAHADVRRNLEAQGYKALSEKETMAIIEAAVMFPSRKGSSGNVVAGLSIADGQDSVFYKSPAMSLIRHAALFEATKAGVAGQQDDNTTTAPIRLISLLQQASTVAVLENIVVKALAAKTCSLLMVSADDINMGKPLSEYGLDSLIALEMRNWISSEIEVTVPVLQLISNQSIEELGVMIAHQTRAAKALGALAEDQ